MKKTTFVCADLLNLINKRTIDEELPEVLETCQIHTYTIDLNGRKYPKKIVGLGCATECMQIKEGRATKEEAEKFI